MIFRSIESDNMIGRMRKICYVSTRFSKMQRNHSCTSKMRKPPNWTNSVMAPYFFIYANRNKAESREVTKQVVWIILRNRIFQGTIQHIRSGFSLYAPTLCALTLLAYALNEPARSYMYKYIYVRGILKMLKGS